MKRFFEYMGLVAIVLGCFYYTEKIALLVQSKNPIMQSINEAKKNEVAVNAIVEGEEIIPGLNGLEINSTKSFLKMQSFGAFNEYYLIFDEVKPKISLEDHKDKIIVKGNKLKNAVSIIFNGSAYLKDYFLKNEINASINAKIDTYKLDNFEYLNGELTKNEFNDFESILNKDKKNERICILQENTTNKELCLKNKNFLVKPSLVLNVGNILEVKNNIESGSIIYINDTAKLEDVNVLIRRINYQGLKIIHLSQLISEEKIME